MALGAATFIETLHDLKDAGYPGQFVTSEDGAVLEHIELGVAPLADRERDTLKAVSAPASDLDAGREAAITCHRQRRSVSA